MAVTLQQAKDYLRIDFNDDDALIESLIATATQWIEKYTDWALSVSNVEISTKSCETTIYTYPIEITSVVDKSNNPVSYTVKNKPTNIIVFAPAGSIINAKIGTASYPTQFDTAIKKLVVYLYENRDAYNMQLPVDVQGLVNQLRRNLF